MERVDGTQARLKLTLPERVWLDMIRGKGGWDSGEIETPKHDTRITVIHRGKGGWDSGEIETGIGWIDRCQY